MKYGLKSGVAFLEGDNLVAFYYLSMSEILPDEMGDLWWEWSYKRDWLWWAGPCKRGTTVVSSKFQVMKSQVPDFIQSTDTDTYF